MNILNDVKKWIIKAFFAALMLLGIVAVIALFFFLIHPLVTRFLIPPLSVHKEVEQYTSGNYKNYEDGDIFASFTESSGLLERGEIVAFYHVNHWLQDNPFYGKQCDYFALDIWLTPEEYALVKAELLEIKGKPFNERDYQVWSWSVGEEKNAYWLGVCDDNTSIKLVLVTGVHDRDFTGTGFYYYSEIDWKSRDWSK